MPDAIENARAMIAERVQSHPASPFYTFAAKEMARVDARLVQAAPPDRAFYETLTHGIGLMCARELEAGDMPFCDAIYSMMAKIRRMIV